MKLTKKANQERFIVNRFYYNVKQLEYLIEKGVIQRMGNKFIVNCDICDKINIELDSDGFYCVKVYTKENHIPVYVVLY